MQKAWTDALQGNDLGTSYFTRYWKVLGIGNSSSIPVGWVEQNAKKTVNQGKHGGGICNALHLQRRETCGKGDCTFRSKALSHFLVVQLSR